MAHSTISTAASAPGVYARTLLVTAFAGAAYLGYFEYKHAGFGAPGALDDRLHGIAAAPDQYRMGVYLVAHVMATRMHIVPAMALTLLGTAAGITAALLLFSVLQSSAVYAQADRTLQWLGAISFVLLIVWTLPWVLSAEKPETMPAAGCVAALVWLWQPRSRLQPNPARTTSWLIAFAVLGISCALASFRADVACAFNLGILGYVLAVRETSLSLARPAAATTAAVAAAASAALQLWLARVVYPQASYGLVKLWQLRPNLIHGTRWPPFVVFLLPLGWTLARALVRDLRRGLVRDHVGRAVLVAAMIYAALWITVGKVDEVRIFVPFAWALAPLTAQMFIERATSPH